MKAFGIIKSYNGRFGIIVSDIGIVDFAKEDISFEQELLIGDVVEFRVEQRFPNIKLARNILLVKLNSEDTN